jgi:hypothetical protein
LAVLSGALRNACAAVAFASTCRIGEAEIRRDGLTRGGAGLIVPISDRRSASSWAMEFPLESADP